jgi:hypothetical protein
LSLDGVAPGGLGGDNQPVSTARPGRTAVAALSAVVASLTLGSGPAFAQGGTTIPDAAYYRTELTAVTPQPSGVSARVDPGR